ncbi:MAG TPA: type II toxin-antitoxin system VapC family toxin [Candidatus Dormibacteraeota bacterium]|nr:type II toxin-antitoxin system VapC family toxin [Candidatus Dormibacteraeota bacterium]
MPGADEPSSAVLDASVAVRWLVPERGSDEAAALMERPVTWIAPRLLVTEVASALRRKVVANELRVEHAVQALAILGQAASDGIVQFVQDEDLVAPALMLALTLEHKVPDCVYLALAQRDGAALATADLTLSRLAENQGTPVLLLPSA